MKIASFRAISRTAATLLASAVLVATSMISGASAAGATVTSGDFHAFAAGAGTNITGHAAMVRTADGKTKVSIHLEGLAPDTTYGSHVHNAACDNNFAASHYRFDPAGPATPPNEIWPGPFATNPDGVGNGHTKADQTAGPEAVSVVVHAPGGAKIACADLT